MKIIFLFIFSFSIFSESFEHQIEGCPLGSNCNISFANLKKDFSALVNKGNLKELNRFVAKNGVLIEGYQFISKINQKKDIWWNSNCKNHGNDIVLTNNFIKDISNFSHFRQLVFKKNKQIVRKYILGKQFPRFLSKKGLIFSYTYEGVYLTLLISNSGKLKFIGDSLPQDHFIIKFKCGQELKNAYISNQDLLKIFPERTCYKIYDLSLKKYVDTVSYSGCY